MSIPTDSAVTINTKQPGGNATGIKFGDLPAVKPEILYEVTAQRGDTLRCKGWKQEAILRMLENNIEAAEHAENLGVYGGIAIWMLENEIFSAIRNGTAKNNSIQKYDGAITAQRPSGSERRRRASMTSAPRRRFRPSSTTPCRSR